MESAWGTSRFAREGRNYFGQWCFKEGCGLVPLKRNKNASHEVRRFNSAQESVRAYLHNLNTNRAYREFRELRYNLRVEKSPLDADILAEGLSRYSEKGMRYVRNLRMLMRDNAQGLASL